MPFLGGWDSAWAAHNRSGSLGNASRECPASRNHAVAADPVVTDQSVESVPPRALASARDVPLHGGSKSRPARAWLRCRVSPARAVGDPTFFGSPGTLSSPGCPSP